MKGWQSGHYVGPGLAVIPDSRRRSEPRSNADCGGYAIDTLAGHDVLDRLTDAEPGEQPEPRVSSTRPRRRYSCRALEVMQRIFRNTINADGNDRCPDTDRGITHHVAMFPRSRARSLRAAHIQFDAGGGRVTLRAIELTTARASDRWFLDVCFRSRRGRPLMPRTSSEDRRIMATRREQDKTMPDHVVKRRRCQT